MSEKKPPRILVISEFTTDPDELDLVSLLREYDQEKYIWICQTVMDTYMKTLPGDITLAILDVGLISGIHREVLDKLLQEGQMLVLAHVTDDRPGALKFLREHGGIWYLKKPTSLQNILAIIDAAAAGEKPSQFQTGETET